MRSTLYATDSSVSCATRVATRSDPLSDALECLHLRCWIPGRFELTAPWGLRSATRLGWYYLVTRPPCHLSLDETDTTTVAAGGDLFMVFPGRKHTLRHGGEGPLASIQTLLVPRHFESREALVHGGGGPPTRLICGCFLLDGLENSPLHAVLPAFIHVQCAAEQPLPYMTHIVRLLELEATAGGEDVEPADQHDEHGYDHIQQFEQHDHRYAQVSGASGDRPAGHFSQRTGERVSVDGVHRRPEDGPRTAHIAVRPGADIRMRSTKCAPSDTFMRQF